MQPTVHFTPENENLFLYKSIQKYGLAGNVKDIRQMRNILYRAIDLELTETQRYCVKEHFLKGKKQKEIAEQLGISRSTVSRHISAGKRKLKKVAQCCAG